MALNDFEQPVGASLAGWTARRPPPRTPIDGRFCRIEPLDPDRHGADLFAAYQAAADGRDWTYLSADRHDTFADYAGFLAKQAASVDPLHYAILEVAGGKAVGTAALMRIDPGNGVIEIGHITFSPALQRTAAATEAVALLIARVFDELGYRRLEWKCDALNGPSRRAAERFGFLYEGLFRQAVVTKGRNRDTAWYAIIDRDWPRARAALEAWLSPANFDAAGRQQRPLAAIRAGLTGGGA